MTQTFEKGENVVVDFNVSIQVKSPRHPWEDLTFFTVNFSAAKKAAIRVPAFFSDFLRKE